MCCGRDGYNDTYTREKEIAIIFIDMACGLAFGMGYVAYGLFFGILAGVVLLALEKLNLWDKKNKTKQRIKEKVASIFQSTTENRPATQNQNRVLPHFADVQTLTFWHVMLDVDRSPNNS